MDESQTLSEYLSQFLPISQRIKARRLLTEEDYRLLYTKAETEEKNGENLTKSFKNLAMEYMILKEYYSNGDPLKMIVENLIKTWMKEFGMSKESFEVTEPEKGSFVDQPDVRFVVGFESLEMSRIFDLFDADDKGVKRMFSQLVADASDYGIRVEIKSKKLLFKV